MQISFVSTKCHFHVLVLIRVLVGHSMESRVKCRKSIRKSFFYQLPNSEVSSVEDCILCPSVRQFPKERSFSTPANLRDIVTLNLLCSILLLRQACAPYITPTIRPVSSIFPGNNKRHYSIPWDCCVSQVS